MGVGSRNRRLDPHNLLIIGQLGPTTLGYTLGDGSYGEVEISRESIALAWAAIQYAIEALSWWGRQARVTCSEIIPLPAARDRRSRSGGAGTSGPPGGPAAPDTGAAG